MMGWHWGGFGWGMMAVGFLCMILFWAVVIGLVLWGVRHYNTRKTSGNDSALEIARQRYAKGEINKEQFEQIKKDLNG
jgi:putative membrane protein